MKNRCFRMLYVHCLCCGLSSPAMADLLEIAILDEASKLSHSLDSRSYNQNAGLLRADSDIPIPPPVATATATAAATAAAAGSCFPAEFFVSEIDGANGLVINGALPDEETGFSVSGVGDVNGDGIDDLVIGTGSRFPCFFGTVAGHPGNTYVVFGAEFLGDNGPMDLATLDGTNGFVISATDADDLVFTRASGIGDINADGINDLLISAAALDVEGVQGAGQAYVVFGNPLLGSSGELDLSLLDGSNGFTISGTAELERVGATLSDAGDPNHDGISDFLVGVNRERCYLIFGGPDPWPAEFELGDLQGETGVNGTSGVLFSDGTFGRLIVSAAGDINNDGIDDIIIGSGVAGKESQGAGYVVFGKVNTWPAEVDLAMLQASEGLVITGSGAFSNLGLSVSAIGDVNDDEVDDVMISAPLEPNVSGDPLWLAGTSYVIFGSSQIGTDGVLSVTTLDGSNGFVIQGLEMFLTTGAGISAAGDMNGDGIADLMLSQAGVAVGFPGGELYVGNDTFVIFGQAGLGSSGVFDLAALDGANGFVIHGIDEYDNTGRSISAAGDLNHDGRADIILGATGAGAKDCKSTAPGATYIIFGQPASCQLCPADLDGDGLVNAEDLAQLLAAWGENPGHPADFNSDGIINPLDLATLLGSWGPCPE